MEQKLPLGTVAYIKTARTPVMVVGFDPVADNGETMQYLAVNYPFGFVGSYTFACFNTDQVLRIVHTGADIQSESALL